MNKLLEKQIKKYLPGDCLRQEQVARFVNAVNDSYKAFEKDLALSAHAFRITEQDYEQINEQLKHEIETRKLGIKNLNEAIKTIDDSGQWADTINEEGNNLIDTLSYLKEQITKRRKVEEELKESEYRQSATANRLKQLISNLNEGILVEDENRQIILVNQMFCNMFGISTSPEKLTGMNSSISILQGKHLFRDPEEFISRIDTLVAGETLVTGDELELVDGRVLIRDYVPIFIDNKYKGHLWKFNDVTEEKFYRKELQRLSLVASANENGVAFCHPAGHIFWANEGLSRLSGFATDEIVGRTPVDVFKGPLSDRNILRSMVDDFTAGRNFNVELLHYKKDGTPFWGRARGQAILDEKGKVVQYFAMVEDITREKESQRKLNEYEYRFKMAFEIIGDNLWEHDFETEVTTSSKRESRFLGYSSSEVADNVDLWWKSILKEDLWLLEETDRKYRKGEIDHHRMEYRLRHKDGTIRWVLDRAVVIEKRPDGAVAKIMGTHTDITNLKETEFALEQRVKQFQGLSENIPGVIFEYEYKKDGSEGLRYMSPAIVKIFGIKPDQSYNILDYIHPDDIRGIAEKINHSRDSLEPYNDEARLVIEGRGVVWRSVSMSFSYFTQDGSKVFTGFMLDTTERKNAEVALIDARHSAEESSHAKETFLANMSHEIRTPLNAILGMSRQLQKSNLEGSERHFLDTINSAAENLLVIINDILDISKIEAGQLALEKIGFSLQEVLTRVRRVMLHKAEETGLDLSFSIDKNIRPVLLGDPYRLNQVLLNLVSNAIKFTEKGSVVINCSLSRETGDKQKVKISVKDTGIGMEKDFLDILFQKFLQEDKTVARKYGGTGLGMSICKQLVELMGGNIEVFSEKGHGTEVSLHILFAVGTDKDLVVKQETVTDASILKERRILLVEDNEMNRLVVTTILHSYGAVVHEAINGLEAIEAVRTSRYDIVLMDVQMPVMDGREATRLIRRDIDPAIPIIALTANAIKGEMDICKAAGMNDYISKPFEEDNLVKIIAHYLETPAGEKINDSTALYSLTRLEEISKGNKPFIQKMLRLFLQEVPEAARQIKDAYVSNDFDAIGKTAHRIKPVLANLCIASLENEIREIERLAATNTPSSLLEEQIEKLDEITSKVAEDIKLNKIID